jgi:hypothetical protein
MLKAMEPKFNKIGISMIEEIYNVAQPIIAK